MNTKEHVSYWIDSTNKKDYQDLKEDIQVDIAIIGGGIAGISSAYMLKNEGLKVAIFEGDHIVNGATGYTTAKITSQHSLIYNKIKTQISENFAKQYADANETAIKTIEKIITDNSIDCDFSYQSAYLYTGQENYIKKIADEVNAASSLGITVEYVEKIPFNFPIKAAMRFDNQAQFHPRKYLLALAKILTDNDVDIFEKTRIVRIEDDSSNSYTLTTDQEKKIIANKVIIASHFPFYNKPSFYYARIYSERSYAIAVKAKDKYPGGMYINIEDPTRSLRSQNTDSGEIIIVGGESHKTGQSKDTSLHYEALIDFASKTFDVQDLPYRWSTEDCMTMDQIPYVGHFTSKTPNLYIITGFNKWGMTNGTASGMIIRDLIINGESPWHDVYNPSRKTILASTKSFLVENLNLTENLVVGKLYPSPKDIDISPGEGAVVEINGERAGAYRDEHGQLHLVNTTCPHMGCELNWNSAEKTWDCPCHGSRFSYTGDVVEGPASKSLKFDEEVNTIMKLIKEDF